VRLSKSKNAPYFFNTATQQSVWDPPSELTAEQIQRLPGAKEYLGSQLAQVRASHLLVKHRGSRRPSSWKEVSLQY
jgi:NIMA-interacting peptidyl-prolyl cis-trans isomerase 1